MVKSPSGSVITDTLSCTPLPVVRAAKTITWAPVFPSTVIRPEMAPVVPSQPGTGRSRDAPITSSSVGSENARRARAMIGGCPAGIGKGTENRRGVPESGRMVERQTVPELVGQND